MNPKLIPLDEISKSGDKSPCVSRRDLSPLLVLANPYDEEYTLIPGQDARLDYMLSLGMQIHPCYVVPGYVTATAINQVSFISSEWGRSGLDEFAIQLIIFLDFYWSVTIDKVGKRVPDQSIKLFSGKDEFTLCYGDDLAGNDIADLLGIAKFILYSHPEHPLRDAIYGFKPDPFAEIHIRNDYYGMFWDTKAEWMSQAKN